MESKESDRFGIGIKIVIAIVIMVALWPLVAVMVECLAAIATFCIGVVVVVALFAAAAYVCGYAYEEVKKIFSKEDT